MELEGTEFLISHIFQRRRYISIGCKRYISIGCSGSDPINSGRKLLHSLPSHIFSFRNFSLIAGVTVAWAFPAHTHTLLSGHSYVIIT